MTIQRSIQVEVEPTPADLAREFWGMDEEKQASFFTLLAFVSEDGGMPAQLEAIIQSGYLSDPAIALMIKIGEYGEAARSDKRGLPR